MKAERADMAPRRCSMRPEAHLRCVVSSDPSCVSRAETAHTSFRGSARMCRLRRGMASTCQKSLYVKTFAKIDNRMHGPLASSYRMHAFNRLRDH